MEVRRLLLRVGVCAFIVAAVHRLLVALFVSVEATCSRSGVRAPRWECEPGLATVWVMAEQWSVPLAHLAATLLFSFFVLTPTVSVRVRPAQRRQRASVAYFLLHVAMTVLAPEMHDEWTVYYPAVPGLVCNPLKDVCHEVHRRLAVRYRDGLAAVWNRWAVLLLMPAFLEASQLVHYLEARLFGKQRL